MPFAAKMVTAGIMGKAVLMATAVSVLVASATFAESLILVIVSATATGIFGLLIVFVQVHSERNLHERIDRLEETAGHAVATTDSIAETAGAIAQATGAETPARRASDK